MLLYSTGGHSVRSSMNLSLKNGSSLARSSPSKLSCFVYRSFATGGRDLMYSLMATQTQMVFSRTRVCAALLLYRVAACRYFTPSRGVDFRFLLNNYVMRNPPIGRTQNTCIAVDQQYVFLVSEDIMEVLMETLGKDKMGWDSRDVGRLPVEGNTDKCTCERMRMWYNSGFRLQYSLVECLPTSLTGWWGCLQAYGVCADK